MISPSCNNNSNGNMGIQPISDRLASDWFILKLHKIRKNLNPTRRTELISFNFLLTYNYSCYLRVWLFVESYLLSDSCRKMGPKKNGNQNIKVAVRCRLVECLSFKEKKIVFYFFALSCISREHCLLICVFQKEKKW